MTLGHAEIPERLVYARAPRTLPVVLGTHKAVRLLEAVPSLKYAHLLENGTNIRIIQVQLGHNNLSSTAR